MSQTINLTYLYPDICNLHGDRGNIWAFEKIATELGLSTDIVRIDHLSEQIDFDNSDIILISPAELTHLGGVTKALCSQKNNLIEYIQKDKYFIVIGTTGAIFTSKVIRNDKSEMEGLGVIPGISKELSQPYGDDIIFECSINDTRYNVCGSQIQMIDIKLDHETKEFGNIKYGYGNNKSDSEGYKERNFIFSNCLGPIFAKNPWLAENILRDIASQKGIVIDDAKKCDFSLQRTSYDQIEKFTFEKETEL